MSWTTPKTDWKTTITDGVYTGDFFNYADYNRIKNNIAYLAQIPTTALTIYASMGNDKAVGDMIYSAEINAFQLNLQSFGEQVGVPYSGFPMFYGNGPTPTYADLNQIEKYTLSLYNILTNTAVYAIDTSSVYAYDRQARRALAEVS